MKSFIVVTIVAILALSASGQTKPADSQTKPVFAALTMDGTKIDTAALRGKVIAINLWFINCPNCVAEIKLLNKVVDEYKDNEDVVFLSLAASRKADLEKFLKKNPFKYQVVPDAHNIIFGKFGTPGKKGVVDMPFPMHYVLDREGSVVVKQQGIKGVEVVRAELKKQFAAKTSTAAK